MSPRKSVRLGCVAGAVAASLILVVICWGMEQSSRAAMEHEKKISRGAVIRARMFKNWVQNAIEDGDFLSDHRAMWMRHWVTKFRPSLYSFAPWKNIRPKPIGVPTGYTGFGAPNYSDPALKESHAALIQQTNREAVAAKAGVGELPRIMNDQLVLQEDMAWKTRILASQAEWNKVYQRFTPRRRKDLRAELGDNLDLVSDDDHRLAEMYRIGIEQQHREWFKASNLFAKFRSDDRAFDQYLLQRFPTVEKFVEEMNAAFGQSADWRRSGCAFVWSVFLSICIALVFRYGCIALAPAHLI